MSDHDLYGSPSLTPQVWLRHLVDALGLVFVERESLFKGVYHTAEGPGAEEFQLLDNHPSDDPDEFPYPEHSSSVSVLSISGTERSAELRAVITAVGDVRLLRHAEHDDPATAPVLSYDLYGSTTRDLDALRDPIATALGARFDVGHDPLRGGRYLRAQRDQEVYSLIDNRDLTTGRPYLTGFDGVITVLDTGATGGSAELRARLEAVDGLTLLRHEEW